jgi:hypothetical protein
MDIGGILEFTPLDHRAFEGFSIPALLRGDDICFCGKVPLSNYQSRTTSASHIFVPRRRPLIVEETVQFPRTRQLSENPAPGHPTCWRRLPAA